jgi:flagellar motor switch protein FliM
VDIEDLVVAKVEGVPVFKARFGESRGNCALKVEEILGSIN